MVLVRHGRNRQICRLDRVKKLWWLAVDEFGAELHRHIGLAGSNRPDPPADPLPSLDNLHGHTRGSQSLGRSEPRHTRADDQELPRNPHSLIQRTRRVAALGPLQALTY